MIHTHLVIRTFGYFVMSRARGIITSVFPPFSVRIEIFFFIDFVFTIFAHPPATRVDVWCLKVASNTWKHFFSTHSPIDVSFISYFTWNRIEVVQNIIQKSNFYAFSSVFLWKNAYLIDEHERITLKSERRKRTSFCCNSFFLPLTVRTICWKTSSLSARCSWRSEYIAV